MRPIPVYNPSRNGKAFCSPKKAGYYIAHGRAVMRPDGTLQFTQANQDTLEQRIDAETQAFNAAVATGRQDQSKDEHGHPSFTVYWNGKFTKGTFEFPPGCNVQLRRIPWRKSRYQPTNLSE
jgi:hypothetical protein